MIFGHCFIAFLFIILNCLIHGNETSNGPSYTIIAPKIVKHWTDYNLIFSLHNTTTYTNVTVAISGSNGLSQSHMNTIQSSGVGTITQMFKMGFDSQWIKGNYSLQVNGTGGYEFTYNSNLTFVNKHYVILVQSNSPIYKPGDIIIFRVIILDEYLRPAKDKLIESMQIYVKDPIGRKTTQFFSNSQKTRQIVLTEAYGTGLFNISNGLTNDISFKLSDDVSLGGWTIEVELTDQLEKYGFSVDNYQTPFATVEIEAPGYKTYTEPIVSLKVDCFYTFGKPVQGLTTILISKHKECGQNMKNITFWSTFLNISGSLETRIDFRDTQLLNVNCQSVFKLSVEVYDEITKQKYSNYKFIEFHQQSIVTKNLYPLQKIKPGLNFRVFIKFLNIEGSEIEVNKLNKLQIDAWINSTSIGTKIAIPMSVVKKSNEMVLDFQTDSYTTGLDLTLKYEDQLISSYSYTKTISNGCQGHMIQIKLQEPLRSISVDDIVNLIITSTESINFLSYYFLVRGNMINASSISFALDSAVLMPILLTKEMAPDVTVVVYSYSSTTGNIVFDSLDLQIDGLFQNKVEIKVKNSSIDVAQTAKFSIQTLPNSQLLIIAIDKAVMRENSNYITESSIIDKLRSIDESKVLNIPDMNKFEFVNIQSSAKYCSQFYEEVEVFSADNYDSTNENFDDHYLRKDYRKTWIWDRTRISGKGKIDLSSRIPDSITSWELSAISLNDQNGLGIASAPLKVTSFRPLFVELKLPYSLVRYEKTEILVMIFNYLPEKILLDLRVEENKNNALDLQLDQCKGNVTIESNQIKIFKCFLMARETGTAKLIVRSFAKSKSFNIKTDAEEQEVIVKFEGVVINQVKEVSLDLMNEEINNDTLREIVEIKIPPDSIEGSHRVYAMTKFDVSKNNWNDLIKKIIYNRNKIDFSPINFETTCNYKTYETVRQINQLNYLKAIDKSDNNLTDSITKYLKTAVNSLCSQFPQDGSILSFLYGKTPPTSVDSTAESSTWMTAYLLKSLINLREYIDIDFNSIYNLKAWLKKQQVLNGEFIEKDRKSSAYLNKNVGHFGLYLTSLAYLALESDINSYEPNPLSVSYIELLYPTIMKNTHDLVIACYVFHVSIHLNRDQCFNQMMKLSVIKDDMRYWLGLDGKPDIETTAYGLLILVYRKVYSIAFSTFKFISIQQRNGILDSLQSSLAFESMSALIKSLKKYDRKPKMIVIGINDGENEQEVILKPENEITQIILLSNLSKQIEILVNGYGSAEVQIVSQYNVKGKIGSAFNTTVMNDNQTGLYVNLTVCTRYNLEGSTEDVVIEIDLPSGYKYDPDGSKNIIELLDRIESINDGSHVNIYIKKMMSEEICLNVPAIQSFKTENLKPAPIKIYPQNDVSKLTVHELIL